MYHHDKYVQTSANLWHYAGWVYDALALITLSVVLWIVSVVTQRAAFADVIRFGWTICLAALLEARSPLLKRTSKQHLVWAIVGFWAARITLSYVQRGGVRRDDWRYADLRDMVGKRVFAVLSLPMVFLGQSVFVWLASLPMYRAMRVGTVQLPTPAFGGVLLSLVGIILETWADEELDKQRGKVAVVDSGPFAWCRHPNYFGELCFWFGFWLLAGAEVGPALAGPVAMAVYIVFVNTPLMEERMRDSRGDKYADYCARVPSALVPIPRFMSRLLGGGNGGNGSGNGSGSGNGEAKPKAD